ncbi:MAG: site-2 protease family protein [Thermomicrobiales bacterium]
MSWSLKLLSVRGIEIKVHATFVLILIWAAYFWGDRAGFGMRGAIFGVVAILLLFVCVVLHELGHSFVALHYGIGVRDITLLPIGGVAALEQIPDKPRQEFNIAIAGPLVNVAIAAVLIVAGVILDATAILSPDAIDDEVRQTGLADMLTYITTANIYLAVFNLIPAFPMDGGRVLRALLAMRIDYRRATEIAVMVGQGMAFLLGLAGFMLGNFFLILIAVFVWFGASQEGQAVALRSVLGRARVGEAMIRAPRTLSPTDPLTRAAELTLNSAQSDFPVVDESGRVVGLLTGEDVIRALHQQPAATIGQVMRTDFPVIPPELPLVEAQGRFAEGQIRALPVVGMDHRLVGLLTVVDISEAYRLLSARPALARAHQSPPGGSVSS